VLAVFVGEEVEDARALQEARDEGEGGLVVLHAVLERVVGAGGLVAVVGEAELREQAGDDVLDRLVLPDAAVRAHGHQPEPRVQLGVIGGEARVAAGLHEATDDAVDVALGAVAQPHRHGGALADDLREVERLLLRLHLQEEVEQPGDALLAANAAQQQFVGAEGGGNGDGLVGLCEGHEVPS
jgi:hypothetical protein